LPARNVTCTGCRPTCSARFRCGTFGRRVLLFGRPAPTRLPPQRAGAGNSSCRDRRFTTATLSSNLEKGNVLLRRSRAPVLHGLSGLETWVTDSTGDRAATDHAYPLTITDAFSRYLMACIARRWPVRRCATSSRSSDCRRRSALITGPRSPLPRHSGSASRSTERAGQRRRQSKTLGDWPRAEKSGANPDFRGQEVEIRPWGEIFRGGLPTWAPWLQWCAF
jgi:hypothetical protein